MAGTAERGLVRTERVDDGPALPRELTARLAAAVTDAVAAVFGEGLRPGVIVDLVGTPDGRTAVGGVLA